MTSTPNLTIFRYSRVAKPIHAQFGLNENFVYRYPTGVQTSLQIPGKLTADGDGDGGALLSAGLCGV